LLRPSSSHPRDDAEPAAPRGAAHCCDMSKTILIIDDDQGIRDLLKIALTSQRSYHVQLAENGAIGLERMREVRPDLVVVDLQMPELNGYQFVVKVQKDESLRHIPILVVTSLTEQSKKSDEEWSKSLGVTAFFSKPFDPMDLIARIDTILGQTA
jgi:two-component system chemotaxis response regulator CheY